MFHFCQLTNIQVSRVTLSLVKVQQRHSQKKKPDRQINKTENSSCLSKKLNTHVTLSQTNQFPIHHYINYTRHRR